MATGGTGNVIKSCYRHLQTLKIFDVCLTNCRLTLPHNVNKIIRSNQEIICLSAFLLFYVDYFVYQHENRRKADKQMKSEKNTTEESRRNNDV